MTEYENVSSKLSEMKSRFDNGFSSLDREFLNVLYKSILGKDIPNKRCGDCYRDAYVEIVNRLRKMGKLEKVEPRNYSLKAGEFINYFGSTEFIINPVTDEQAEMFLAKFPKRIVIFDVYPSDWQERCAKRLALQENAETEKESSETPAPVIPTEQTQTEGTAEIPDGEGAKPEAETEQTQTEEEIPMIDEDGNIAGQEEKKQTKRNKTEK